MNYNNRNHKSPFGTFGMFHDILNEVFDVVQTAEKTLEKAPSLIRANITEANDMYYLTVELPGLTKKDIKLDIEERILKISVEKTSDADVNFLRKEFNYDKASRQFKLSNAVDTSSIDAEMKDGLLKISLAKKPAFVPKDIKIK